MEPEERPTPITRRAFGQVLAASAAALTIADGAQAAIPVAADGAGIRETVAPAAIPQDAMMQAMNRFIDELAEGDPKPRERIAPTKWRDIAMMAYPGMYPLGLLGPLTVFSDLLNTRIHLVWKTKTTVSAGRGVQLQTIPFSECPTSLDVLFVPGGTVGTISAMQDADVLSFLRSRAPQSRFGTSVCTGSLILGAAGLLDGYRATSHWLVHDLLANFGATPVQQRVVEDRNRITGAGVTAGLDFALTITARLAGENYAKAEQLNIEYDPAPPFAAGTEAGAGPLVAGAMRRMYRSAREGFVAAVPSKRG